MGFLAPTVSPVDNGLVFKYRKYVCITALCGLEGETLRSQEAAGSACAAGRASPLLGFGGQPPEGAALTCTASRGSDTTASQGQAQELISNHGPGR